MVETPNYHWPLTPQSEERTTTVEAWTRRLTGDDENSVLMDIDKNLARSAKWSVYLGENLSSLSIYASQSKNEAMAPSEGKELRLIRVEDPASALLSDIDNGGGDETSFDPLAYSYIANVPISNQYITIVANGNTFVNRVATVQSDGAEICSSPLPISSHFLLKPGKVEEPISITIHPAEDSSGKTYNIILKKQCEAALENMWVSKAEETTATDLDKMWLADDIGNPMSNYQAGIVDSGVHDIYVSDLAQKKLSYGVMVDTLQTYVRLNAKAPGTAENGGNEDYYIIISEYGVDDPQTVDSRTYVNKTAGSKNGHGLITDARFRLDPSQNGTQVFQFTIVNKHTGAEGAYYLTIYRNGAGSQDNLSQQTWLKGQIITASMIAPDYEANYALYRKNDQWKLKTVDETTAELYGMTADNSTFTERFTKLFDSNGADGKPMLVEAHTGITDKVSGSYEIAPEQIGEPGTYLLLFQRDGYLDYTLDNLLVYKTWAEAEYDFGTIAMRPGDLDHDGVIGTNDMNIFNQYCTAVDGTYRDNAGLTVLSNIRHTGFDDRSVVAGDTLSKSEIDAISLTYKGVALDPVNFPDNPVYYLSQKKTVNKIADLHDAVVLTGDYEFTAVDVSTGTIYLQAALRYTDNNLRPDLVDVIYRVATITVTDVSVNNVMALNVKALEPDLAHEPAMLSQEAPQSLSDISGFDPDTFDPHVMDFDGNGFLNDGDLGYIMVYWNMSANTTCYRNNPFAIYETILQPHVPHQDDQQNDEQSTQDIQP